MRDNARSEYESIKEFIEEMSITHIYSNDHVPLDTIYTQGSVMLCNPVHAMDVGLEADPMADEDYYLMMDLESRITGGKGTH